MIEREISEDDWEKMLSSDPFMGLTDDDVRDPDFKGHSIADVVRKILHPCVRSYEGIQGSGINKTERTVWGSESRDEAVFILSGHLVVRDYQYKIQEQMVLLDEGKVVGLDLISNPERVPRSQRAVEAYGKTAVIVMRGEELRKLMIVVPKLALNAINILAHVINSIDSRRRLMIFDVKQRVAAFLYLVSKSQKHLYYTDKAMADELFTTRESVNRAISVLQNAGHITKSQRKIVVNNRDALIRDLNPKKQTKKPRAR